MQNFVKMFCRNSHFTYFFVAKIKVGKGSENDAEFREETNMRQIFAFLRNFD